MEQKLEPVENIHAYFCAFHIYNFDPKRQVEAHHYCSMLGEEVRQCVIYDSAKRNAKLIGVEYIISEELFLSLDDEEKKLWHSHQYEVKSGILFMPGMPKTLEHQEMATLAKTYGKTFHFWQVDLGHRLPLGLPQLMASFTSDGQFHPDLARDAEKRFNISFEENRKDRVDLEGPKMGIHPLADQWVKGKAFITTKEEVSLCKSAM